MVLSHLPFPQFLPVQACPAHPSGASRVKDDHTQDVSPDASNRHDTRRLVSAAIVESIIHLQNIPERCRQISSVKSPQKANKAHVIPYVPFSLFYIINISPSQYRTAMTYGAGMDGPTGVPPFFNTKDY